MVQAIDDGDDDIQIGHLLLVIWRGWFKIILFTVLALIFGMYKLSVTLPVYQADALLQLEDRSSSLALPSGLSDLMAKNPQSGTELEIFRSRLVLGQVVADLNLDWAVSPVLMPLVGNALTRYDITLPDWDALRKYVRFGDALTLNLLEVPPAWLGAAIKLKVTGPDTFTITTPDDAVYTGTVGTVLRPEGIGFALRIGTMTAPTGREFNLVQQHELSTIGQLREGLSISERGRQSGILEARFRSTNRVEAQRILNAVLQAYVRQNIDRGAAEAESSLEFIESQLPQSLAHVQTAERALNDLLQAEQSIDINFETQNLLTQIGRFETQLRELQAQEDEISQRYTTSHPIYQQLLIQRARLDEQLTELRQEVSGLPETQREVLNLSGELELAQQIYTQLLTRAQEVRVLRASNVGNVRVVDSAQASAAPISPNVRLTQAAALLAGFLLGVFYVLISHWMRKGIQSADELERLGLPVFATVNQSAHVELRSSRSKSVPLLAISTPNDLVVEAFRSLRTSLHFAMLDSSSKTLAISSPAPDAGKSFCSGNLAVVSAQSGQTVCLVDADLRRGALRKHFNVAKNAPGLTEVLSGTVKLEDALVKTSVDGLMFLPTGRYPPNPSELLARPNFLNLMQQLDGMFDLSILDCPPVLAVTDPVIIGRHVGSTIVVVRHVATPLGEVQAMQAAFDAGGVKIQGAIFNGFDPKKAKAGSSYSYRYAYNTRDD
jgi:tyrosine-protein kinase Etk/Wzc